MSEIDILRKNVFNNLQAIEEKDKEIERLNNIINEYELYLNDLGAWSYLDKLKRLKEGKNA